MAFHWVLLPSPVVQGSEDGPFACFPSPNPGVCMRTSRIARKNRGSDGGSSRVHYPPATTMVGPGLDTVPELRQADATAGAMAPSVGVAL